MRISKKAIIFYLIFAFFIALDCLLKILCLKGVFNKSFSLINDIFSLHFVKNYYISFSIPLSGPILTITIGIIILVLFISLIKNFKYSLTILLIGAIINFIDRLKFGYVIDYFDLKWFTVFNLADIMIITGIFWLIIENIKLKKIN